MPGDGDRAAEHHPVQGQFPAPPQEGGSGSDSPRAAPGAPSPQHHHAQQWQTVQRGRTGPPGTKTGPGGCPGGPGLHPHPSVPRVPSVPGAAGAAAAGVTGTERGEPGVGQGHQQQRARVTLGPALGWDERVLFHFTEHGLVQCQLVFKSIAVTRLLQSELDFGVGAKAGGAGWGFGVQHSLEGQEGAPRAAGCPEGVPGKGGTWWSRYCSPRGCRGSWNCSPLQGQEKGHWRCLSIVPGGCSPRAGWGILFAVAVGREESLFWVFLFNLGMSGPSLQGARC